MRYGEVAQAVNRWAVFLTEKGVRPGQVVAVYCKRSCELVLAFWRSCPLAGYICLCVWTIRLLVCAIL